MTDEQTILWIFLAIATGSQKASINIGDLALVAEAINHAVPTHKELQTSISWLTNNSLIIKNNRRYNLTKLGHSELKNAPDGVESLYIIWKNLESRFFNYQY
jgi:hypothetical protein